jgi:adenosylcobinamide-GDP ribazoletransferase
MSSAGSPPAFLGALQFLTRVPVRLRSAPDLAASVPWFPVVGALIGAVVGGVAAGLQHIVPATVAAVTAIVFGMVATGAFHEDGLADTADAMDGWDPQRRREILADPRHGSYGVAAMVGTILIRVLCVASLGPAVAFSALVAAHTLGRGAAVAVMGITRSAATEGLGADHIRALRPLGAIVGVAAAVLIGTAALGWWVIPSIGGVVLGAAAVAVVAHRAFGGVNGDVLGAVEQVGECAVLIVASGLAIHHTVWWA